MFNIYKFYSNDLEIFLSIIVLIIISIFLYDKIKFHGKLIIEILKMQVNVSNKDNWNDANNEIKKDTKSVELDFVLRLCNNKNTYNNIYDINVTRKKESIYNNYLYLVDKAKSFSGATTYEKLKIINFLPYEVKEYHIKIKLEKDEILNIKKEPIYIRYKIRGKNKKIKLNKYLKSNKKQK